MENLDVNKYIDLAKSYLPSFGFYFDKLNIGEVLFVTLIQLALVLGPLILVSLFTNIVSMGVEKRIIQLLGRKVYIYVLGWIGTPLHEVGHALMCLLFNHRISAMKVFGQDKITGALGYVKHSWNKMSVYQRVGNFFIAIGPLIMGGVIISILAIFICPMCNISVSADALGSISTVSDIPVAILVWFKSLALMVWQFFVNFDVRDYKAWIFVYILLAVGSHINLSVADLKSARAGLIAVSSILLLYNVLKVVFTDIPLKLTILPEEYMALMAAVIFISGVLLLPIWIILEAASLVFGKRGKIIKI